MEKCNEYECKGLGFDYFNIANYLMKVTENPKWGKCLFCKIFSKRYARDYPCFQKKESEIGALDRLKQL